MALLLAGCDRFTGPDALLVAHGDDSLVPEALREAYREDAGRLALRYLIESDHPARNDVRWPKELAASLYHALIHVYNAVDLAERDTVVERYPIHSFGLPAVRELLVIVEPNAPWLDAWRRGESTTGNVEVDRLLSQYDLKLAQFYDLSFDWDMAVLRGSEPLNVAALAPHFDRIEGVRYAEPNQEVGGQPDIQARLGTGYWRLDYSWGWGDCPSGCISRHHWTFNVHADGRVEFVESVGPPPEPT
ncbi:MAG: hypothetical protein ACREMC_10750 [Gemmatimonadales bacterium]